MKPFLYNKNIDLVDFEDLKLFMFRNDNLYNIAVSENRKNQSLTDYQKHISQNGYLPSLITPENVDEISDPRFGVYIFLNHLWKHDVDFTILDIGSYICDFSLKIANCIRTFQKQNKVISFDPTEAGALVSYNIELNGLGEIVRHEDLAISDFDGLMLFDYTPGHSDSAHIAERVGNAPTHSTNKMQSFLQKPLKEKLSLLTNKISRTIKKTKPPLSSYNFIARGVDILSYMEREKIVGNLFIKIDIEGVDMIVINRLLQLLPERLISIIFEFAPRDYDSFNDAVIYLKNLGETFYVFDLFYSPNPTRWRLIDATKCESFVRDVAERKYRYTDIFLLDKRTPDCNALVERLSKLKETPDRIMI